MSALQQAPVELNISPEKISFIVQRAREFDGALAETDEEEAGPGGEAQARPEFADDPAAEELSAAIDQLGDDEIVDLIALTWVGRGDFDRSSWEDARALAAERHRRRSSRYLMGVPLLGDYIEEGLAELGRSCAEGEDDER
jgi:hypothetical protein